MNTVRALLHDMRNELGIVYGFLNLIRELKLSKEKISEGLGSVDDLLLRCVSLIDRLLDKSRTLEQVALAESDFVLTEFTCEDVVDCIEDVIKVHPIAFKVLESKLSDDCRFFVKGAAGRIALENAITNAINAKATRVLVDIKETPRTIRVAIRDNGQGMTKSELQEIGFGFTTEGTGLGTQIIRDSMNECRGCVTWSSIKFVGTVCTLVFKKVPNE